MHPLTTDLYQLTMAKAYLDAGIAEDDATFDLFFRSMPMDWEYLVACGVDEAVRSIEAYVFNWAHPDAGDDHFLTDSLYKLTIIRPDLIPVCDYLEKNIERLANQLHVWAVREGTVIFPNEPVIIVKGPRILGQLLETALLNIVNYQTLIASKASRMVQAAGGNSKYARAIMEFGLRRAQGEEAACKGARAAYIAGCVGTSNVYAGLQYDIPIMGTHAHAFVMSFPTELDAFRAYAKSFPDNTTLLIDTYDTIQGVKNAAIVAHEMEKRGQKLVGVRLDSGDLLNLSREVRVILNSQNLQYVKIVASNDLNEGKIKDLLDSGASIDTFGVGTELITAKPTAALPGVYKLVADVHGDKVKLSPGKKTYPGLKQVWRTAYRDVIGLADEKLDGEPLLALCTLGASSDHARIARQRCAASLVAVTRRHQNDGRHVVVLSDTLQKRHEAAVEKATHETS